MRRRFGLFGWLVAALGWAAVPSWSTAQSCADPRPAPAGPAVYVQDLNLAEAGDATIEVKLATGGQSVAGTQNDLAFPAGVAVKTKPNGKPDCAVNPDIDKGATSFAFRQAGCPEGSTCVRALVLSTDNVNEIPDGSVLYTCNVTVAGSGGTVGVSGVILSTPAGGRVDGASGREGVVCVAGGPPPSACADPRPAPAGPAVYVQDLNLAEAGDATIEVKLATGGQSVAGTQNDLAFPAGVAVKTKPNGKPDCAVNPDIDKGATSFAFRQAGCPEGSTCVRALVLSTDNVNEIPDGSVLYTCNVTVAGSGGTVGVSGVILSTPAGGRVDGASGREGVVCVAGVQPPTPTHTPTEGPATPTPTNTQPPTATNTPVPPTATFTVPRPTATATATATPRVVEEDEGGCHVVAGSSSGFGWLLVVPAVVLAVRRRVKRARR